MTVLVVMRQFIEKSSQGKLNDLSMMTQILPYQGEGKIRISHVYPSLVLRI